MSSEPRRIPQDGGALSCAGTAVFASRRGRPPALGTTVRFGVWRQAGYLRCGTAVTAQARGGDSVRSQRVILALYLAVIAGIGAALCALHWPR